VKDDTFQARLLAERGVTSDKLTPEQRSERNRKGWANATPEQRRARTLGLRRGLCVRWHGDECRCWQQGMI
jgi:hypothetical protein